MKSRNITILTLMILFVFGYITFSIKHEVENLRVACVALKKELMEEKNSITILKTEYVYLSSPGRIKKLVEQNLALSAASPDQMVGDPTSDHDLKDNVITSIVEKKSVQNVKWRYKKMNPKYLARK